MDGAGAVFRQYLDWTDRFRGRLTLFRGIDDEDQMWPAAVRSFARSRGAALDKLVANSRSNGDTLREFEAFERSLFTSFRREAALFPDRQPEGEWQWLAL